MLMSQSRALLVAIMYGTGLVHVNIISCQEFLEKTLISCEFSLKKTFIFIIYRVHQKGTLALKITKILL